ncbi:Coq4 family protein [Crocosphaera sp.]|uniref:Coq4 family protein n=1 Tax=Crocosphaera sp. TaxID=2729996 RepID=UPI002614BF66|nr:Coq4 family protein [Crocosphaera sp.]MDJ0578729.1 Coq4 family protein [Crocosphaera sp.]
MLRIEDNREKWEELALQRFLEMLRAKDGDLEVVGKLFEVLFDVDSLKKIATFLKENQEGKQAFKEYHCLGDVDLNELHKLPENTLGYCYSNHLKERGLTPLNLEQIPINNDSEFILLHIRETHDIWHVITGFDTDIIGEIQLEAFCVKQLRFSRFWLSLLAKNLLKTTIYQIENSEKYLNAITEGWIMANNASPLFGIRWDQFWNISLEDIRTSLNIKRVQLES